jgi:hypothetical protein
MPRRFVRRSKPLRGSSNILTLRSGSGEDCATANYAAGGRCGQGSALQASSLFLNAPRNVKGCGNADRQQGQRGGFWYARRLGIDRKSSSQKDYRGEEYTHDLYLLHFFPRLAISSAAATPIASSGSVEGSGNGATPGGAYTETAAAIRIKLAKSARMIFLLVFVEAPSPIHVLDRCKYVFDRMHLLDQ